jgi:hypothetical protein
MRYWTVLRLSYTIGKDQIAITTYGFAFHVCKALWAASTLWYCKSLSLGYDPTFEVTTVSVTVLLPISG